MLRDDIARYTELSGNDGEHTPIGIIGAFLDGYETGLKDKELPSAFEGKTNGEVIQAIFNVMVLTVKDGKVWVECIFFPFDEVWWNTPYKAESEGTK